MISLVMKPRFVNEISLSVASIKIELISHTAVSSVRFLFLT